MKQISIFLAFIFTLSLIFPGGRVVVNAANLSQNHELNPREPVEVFVQPTTPVKAVEVKIAARGLNQFFLGCAKTDSLPAGKALALPQNSSLINFNQPASCFSLQVAKAAELKASLEVKPLAVALPKIVVPLRQSVISFFNPAAAGPVSALPLVPGAVFAIGLALAFKGKKNFIERLKNSPISTKKFELSLSQLQMLRC